MREVPAGGQGHLPFRGNIDLAAETKGLCVLIGIMFCSGVECIGVIEVI